MPRSRRKYVNREYMDRLFKVVFQEKKVCIGNYWGIAKTSIVVGESDYHTRSSSCSITEQKKNRSRVINKMPQFGER